MNVAQLPLDRVPALASLAGQARARLDRHTPTPVLVGEWPTDLYVGPPDVDQPHAVARYCAFVGRPEAPAGFEVRGTNYYPAGGGMGWHTNSDAPGWRIYLPCLAPRAPSGMLTEGGFVLDRAGFANVFRVDVDDFRKSWHAVHALSPRLTVGLRVSAEPRRGAWPRPPRARARAALARSGAEGVAL